MTEVVPSPDRPTVLIVDDEVDLREIIRRMLERRGFEVLLAAEPEQAIAVCADHSVAIDVLVTDLTLPGLSGGELARTALTLRPGMGVIFISGLPKDIAVSRELIEPDALLVKKPFTADQLIETVQAVLSQRTAPTA